MCLCNCLLNKSLDLIKVEAVVKPPLPENRENLLERLFMLLLYYGRHVPKFSLLAGPLNELRKYCLIRINYKTRQPKTRLKRNYRAVMF